MKQSWYIVLCMIFFCSGFNISWGADQGNDAEPTVIDSTDPDLKTDNVETVVKSVDSIQLDGISSEEMRELRDKAEKFAFQAEVSRLMKLIINSLYTNKHICIRELISNSVDAINKIRIHMLTREQDDDLELSIRIKTDTDSNMLHITDTGIGMTKTELEQNLGTIAKSGTAEILNKLQESANAADANDMIGQFGVGFYSAFLVADDVSVISKHENDTQYIWESDAASFTIVKDPRGNTLVPHGTTVSLRMKPEAKELLDHDKLKGIIKKYSQFVNYPIYLWTSRTDEVEEDDDEEVVTTTTSKPTDEEEEEGTVEEEKDEATKPKKKKVQKTVWDWELLNGNKPIWTRKPADIGDDEYNEFYKSLTKDTKDPLAKVHFTAEGEVSFKSILFLPRVQDSENLNRYGTRADHIKLHVRRVFISDEFDVLPKYLNFIKGLIDSDDLPLNVSRETLQQHTLLKIIAKKLIRKVLDMFKNMAPDAYETFWKEYSTNIKLGTIEDPGNRVRLAKLLRFTSSKTDTDKMTSLADYVQRMKPNQEKIFYIAGASKDEVRNSPFVERLLRKDFEVLYLTEAIDEYALNAIPEFDGKKFQNVAKEGFTLDQHSDEIKTTFEPLTKWLSDVALKDYIAKAQVSERLTDSPCALVASMFGWTGNMERMAISNAHQKSDDVQRSYYLNQKKTFEINPRHPLIKELLRRVRDDTSDEMAKDTALMLFRTATLRSGYMLQETVDFAKSIEVMMRKTLGVATDEPVDEDEEDLDEETATPSADKLSSEDVVDEHDEL